MNDPGSTGQPKEIANARTPEKTVGTNVDTAATSAGAGAGALATTNTLSRSSEL